MEVGEDVAECSIRDLMECWSGERGSQMLVNRVQSMLDNQSPGGPSEFLLFNVCEGKEDRRGVWVRMGKSMSKSLNSGLRNRLPTME
jgi:hypothetical protein